MAVEGSLFSVNYRIIAVDPHYLVIVKDGEGEDFLVKLLFTLHKSKEFNNPPHYQGYAIPLTGGSLRVLSEVRHSLFLTNQRAGNQ